MKTLTYTAEKDNSIVSVSNRLMVSEYQINDLLDSLVANGYTILTTLVGEGDDSQHWQGQSLSVPSDKITNKKKKLTERRKKMKLEVAIWNGKHDRCLAVLEFNSVKELEDFMKELHKVDSKATYTLRGVRK